MILHLRLLDWSQVRNQNMPQLNDTAKLGKADVAYLPGDKCNEDKVDCWVTPFKMMDRLKNF